ncbi:nuclease-related domain-containing protein [Ferrimonas balearica]|uniref:nuclease-related domain-containing protein n=1 Tax=Ferrimonas balearica TaxID=44012 RepID=UPI001F3B82CD|nr:nuclease-related domain-containing protein [Ferrimonas balearica]MBY6093636.1 NERD domain-containing protein [Ferrimonas balearica]
MILKERDQRPTQTASQHFGAKQEQDVAFYLRRQYANDPNVFVINDLRFEHQGEVIQIDHLLVFRHGFILIESKSIFGEVRVNKAGEWSRSYKGKWQGMASPLQQVSLQEKGLKLLLQANSSRILPKMLGIQQGFGGRRYERLCAVSSSALLHRDSMPKEISQTVIKSEFIVDKLKAFTSVGTLTGLIKTLPFFSNDEMTSICDFLIQQHRPTPIQPEPALAEKATPSSPTAPPTNSGIACKQCGGTDALSGAWGKYGYFVVCSDCKVNTTMKGPCTACASKSTKVSKKGACYSRHCQDCGHQQVLFEQRVGHIES